MSYTKEQKIQRWVEKQPIGARFVTDDVDVGLPPRTTACILRYLPNVRKADVVPCCQLAIWERIDPLAAPPLPVSTANHRDNGSLPKALAKRLGEDATRALLGKGDFAQSTKWKREHRAQGAQA